MRRPFRAVLALSVVAIGASATQAASITVTSIPTSTTDFGYLSSALNATDPLLVNLNGPAVTVNGANFAAGTNFANGSATGSGTGGVTYALTGPSITAFAGPFASGASDPNVATLLNQFFYGGSNRDETLTVSGLLPGHTDTITILGAAFGAGSTSGREESLSAYDGTAGATFPSYEENNGAFSRVDYTAIVPSSGFLSISSHALDANGDTLHYYAFTVSQSATPEPATLGLIAVGGLGLLARRRRVA